MKQLPKLLIFSLLLTIVGCSREYDDSALVGRVNNLESRVLKLEQLCQQMNTNISSLQTIVSALQNNDYVTGVVPVTEGGKTVGYTISFTKSQPVTIYHGKDGVDGKNGTDGKDGQNGADGKDGKSYVPVIGVRQDTDGVYYWTLDGKWLIDGSGNKVKAEGRDGKNGADGKDGLNGSDGRDGSDGKNGQDGADGKDGANGADGRDGITPVLKIEDNYWFISYDNGGSWTKLGKATGENGRDGVDGRDGKDGENGRDGVDGKDGKDGENGRDGVNGKDGINPLLQIIDGYWYASYDNGSTWQELGKATGADGKDGHDGINGADGRDGDSFFRDVTQDDSKVHFILADGTVITLPKAVALDIVFAESDLVVMSPNSTRTISFTVTSTIKPVVVEVVSSADIKAKVILDDADGLAGKIQLTTSSVIDEYSKVVVFVSNGEKVIMRSIRFEEAGLKVEENSVKTISAEGGEVTLEFLTNVECEVVIPDKAKSWISVVPDTRAMEKRSVTLKAEPNAGYYRYALITVSSSDGRLELEYKIEQNGALGVEIDAENIPDNEIWYTTNDGKTVNLELSYPTYNSQPFDANIISHTYENGKGVIKCDAPITAINDYVFGNGQFLNISQLILPNSVTTLGQGAVNGTGIRKLKIPNSLVSVGPTAFRCSSNSYLEQFEGKNVTDDGRCLVIDGKLCGFAQYGISSYTIPSNVEHLEYDVFAWCKELKKINFVEGLKQIDGDAFNETELNCDIYLPESLISLHPYAFHGCKGIKGFYGNSKFCTSDHFCLLSEYLANQGYPAEWCGTWILRFCGTELTEYSIPDGVRGIENYAFDNLPNLRSITLPTTIAKIGGTAFNNCSALESIKGSYASSDGRCAIIGNELALVALAGLTEYRVPNGVETISGWKLMGLKDIKVITIPDSVKSITDNYAFSNCPSLVSITLSANLAELGYDAFASSPSIRNIYCRSQIPPRLLSSLGLNSYNENVVIYVPRNSVGVYRTAKYWSEYADKIMGYDFSDLPVSDYYISSDYTQDGKVTTLQSATEGKGINIVLMGDAYSDRQIADGTYGADMKYIYDNLFTEEPYKSFKEYFNVYSVNVVSATEGYEHEGATLGGYFGDGTLVGGNDSKCFEYAAKAVGEQNMDETLVVVAMNSNNYAGTCYMYNPSSTTGTYGSGASVAYFPKGGDKETFARLLHHEACGHGFAKLADEYAYESMGAVPSDYASQIQTQQSSWGWWKNVDFTGDVSSVRWNAFTNDSRYANEGLGAFEGGLTYWTGVWRPTENSIMRDNTGGFNAPSREAIYCRIHKLAYGDSWNYSYEDFVTYDEINRKASSSSAPRRSSGRQTRWEPLHPPVVVGKSWKEAAKTQ